jgi:hypothetical protein
VEQVKYYRLHLYSGKVTLAATYLRRVRVVGRSFAEALAHVSNYVTPPASAAKASAWASGGLGTHFSTTAVPPAPEAQNLGVGLRRPRGRSLAGEEQLSKCSAEQIKYYRLYLYSGEVTLAAVYLRRVRVLGR